MPDLTQPGYNEERVEEPLDLDGDDKDVWIVRYDPENVCDVVSLALAGERARETYQSDKGGIEYLRNGPRYLPWSVIELLQKRRRLRADGHV